MSTAAAHVPVLLEACLAALALKPDGHYIDGTYGRGGHSRAILAALGPHGRLLGLDRDPAAVADGERLQAEDGRFRILHAPFSGLRRVVAESDFPQPIDGILLDLGVSSPQLDDPARGFSFLRDGPLDMRMDPGCGPSASEWLAEVSERELADVLFQFGDERYSRRIARAICQARDAKPLATTAELAAVVAAAHPRWQHGIHPATRSFQAIRIHINRELGELETALAAATALLQPEGRLAIICFHSLEDRMVKRFLRGDVDGDVPPWLRAVPPFRSLGKAVAADDEERERNPRARSAHLRVGVRQ
jgi:16S rRNA (cytosine1402-N4)-methyltransferase